MLLSPWPMSPKLGAAWRQHRSRLSKRNAASSAVAAMYVPAGSDNVTIHEPSVRSGLVAAKPRDEHGFRACGDAFREMETDRGHVPFHPRCLRHTKWLALLAHVGPFELPVLE